MKTSHSGQYGNSSHKTRNVLDVSQGNLADEASRCAARHSLRDAYRQALPHLAYHPSSIRIARRTLPCGSPVNIGYLPDRRPAGKSASSANHIVRYEGTEFSLRFRGRPYTDFHMVLDKRTWDQNAPPTCQMISVGFAVARMLGGGSELFYNRVAPTWDRFHYQIVASGNMTLWESDTSQWPAFTVREEGEDVKRMSDIVCGRMNEFLRRGAECDLALKCVADHFHSIMIPRRKTRPNGVFGNDRDFGTFGVLEMSGYFVSAKTENACRILEAPQWGQLYEDALRELSFS